MSFVGAITVVVVEAPEFPLSTLALRTPRFSTSLATSRCPWYCTLFTRTPTERTLLSTLYSSRETWARTSYCTVPVGNQNTVQG